MDGRNDVTIAAALEAMTQAMQNQLNADENAGSRSLVTFQRENPPMFKVKRCYHCDKTGHMSSDCKHKDVVCFNCGVEGHIDSQCQKPKKTAVGGKVLALSGTQTSSEDGLVRGTCLINSIHLITIIDTGATHSFIAADCVKRLGLTLSA
ncbi:uncharacterized protein LOC131619166 [Vicia villosa]|uniref:uncharacterized protein LOC131619166 n=1 Tax=Vicia villosa TaxID=3911 RepID=UPI00273BC315|nr:uncharacterized protein LOC131619166 [Vicia villosa]